MLTLSNLKPKIKKLPRVRRGRGLGSGRGAYSGRGIKGQKARTGGNIRPGFEGGRMPLIRQMPKRKGFHSPHPRSQIVSLGLVAKIFADGATVSPKTLTEKGLIQSNRQSVKIVDKNAITRKFIFEDIHFTAGAKEQILKAGGIIKQGKPANNV